MNRKINFSFWLITISVFTVLICPLLLQDGMFMDGQQYACVSKNLAAGLGTFWFPYLSETWWKAGSGYFMEHPPLIYGIQSQFFKLFGESMYIERFYSLLTALITAFFIIKIWNLLFTAEPENKKISWLPVLFWIIVPVCYWSYQNNMQENTMGIFTLSSVYFILKSLENKRHSLFWFFLAGVFIFLAAISKGPPGLFPLAVVSLYWISYRNISISKTIVYSASLILIVVVFFSIVLINNQAYESLTFYINERLLQRISSEAVVQNRFYILLKLFLELLPPLIIGAIIIIISQLKSKTLHYSKKLKNNIIFFTLVGISASFPLMLTSVQKGFYFVPALPFFGIAIAIIVLPALKVIINGIDSKWRYYKVLNIIAILLLCSAITFSILKAGKTGRDQDMLHDVYLIGDVVPNGDVIDTDRSVYDQWNLQFYFIRHFNISVNPSSNNHTYYLAKKESDNYPPDKYIKAPLLLKRYDLYKLDNTKPELKE